MKLNYDKNHADLYLGAALTAYREALNLAVDALVKLNGSDDLAWFDDLRSDAVRSAKGTVAEQIPVEVEAAAIRFGFEAINTEFENIRLRLIKKE